MKKHLFKIFPLLIVFLFLFSGCSDGGAGSSGDNGTVTVVIENSWNSEDIAIGLFAASADPGTEDPLAAGMDVGDGGTVTITLEEYDGAGGTTGTNWIGTYGTSYDLYVFFDADSSGDPTSGDQVLNDFPLTVTIDGNITVTKSYSTDFTAL